VCQFTASGGTNPISPSAENMKSLGQSIGRSTGIVQAFGADRTKLTEASTKVAATHFGHSPETIHFPPGQVANLPHSSVDLTEFLDHHFGKTILEIHETGFIPVPMIATEFKGNTFPSATTAVAGGALTNHPGVHTEFGGDSTKKSTSSTETFTIDPRLFQHGGLFKAPGPLLCDTILLASGASIQLYAIWNNKRRIVDQRVRYTRVDASGKIITDAMLARAEVPLR
jgi:hypothetical protein